MYESDRIIKDHLIIPEQRHTHTNSWGEEGVQLLVGGTVCLIPTGGVANKDKRLNTPECFEKAGYGECNQGMQYWWEEVKGKANCCFMMVR